MVITAGDGLLEGLAEGVVDELGEMEDVGVAEGVGLKLKVGVGVAVGNEVDEAVGVATGVGLAEILATGVGEVDTEIIGEGDGLVTTGLIEILSVFTSIFTLAVLVITPSDTITEIFDKPRSRELSLFVGLQLTVLPVLPVSNPLVEAQLYCNAFPSGSVATTEKVIISFLVIPDLGL